LRPPRYSPAQFSELLGIDKRRLLDLEREGALPEAKRDPATDFRYYLPEEGADYRKLLNLPPVVRSHRRQLFLNFKGGTGKSSISASYGYRAAELGARTLLVDLDPQGHLTRCLGFNGSDFELTLYEVLIDKHDIRDAVVETGMKTLHLLPANIRLSPIELSLMSQNAREWRLRRALEPLSGTYDLVVLDSPPNIGLLNLNAILATDDLIVPVLADFLSYDGLRLLFDTLVDIEEDFDFRLKGIHIVLNLFNPSRNICLRSQAALQENYPEYLLKSVIRQNTTIADATSLGLPIFQHAPSSRGARDIDRLVREVLMERAKDE
jgi:chromosome partitioning protein